MTTTYTVADTAPALTGTVNANLTGATLAVHIKKPDNTVIDAAATIVDGPTGTWSRAWAAGNLNQAGEYTVELQVTFSGGTIETFALLPNGTPSTFRVRDQIA